MALLRPGMSTSTIGSQPKPNGETIFVPCRPAALLNVFVRFTLNGVATELRDGEYAVRPTWQWYVPKVLRMGTPGEWSHVGIVHESLG